MARPRRHAILATVFCAVLSASGCTGSPSQPVTLPSLSSTPSASSSSLSPQDQAKQAAKAVIEKYWATYTRCLEDPQAPPTCFDNVAISIELQNLQNTLSGARQVGSKASGAIKVLSMDLVSVDLTNRVNETPPTVPYVVYRVCVDVSGFQVVDKTGKSLIPATRLPQAATTMSVANYRLPDPTQWRVDSIGNEALRC